VSGFTVRPRWHAAPDWLKTQVVAHVGVIRQVDDVHGGMTPGPAAVLTSARGERVFVKAVAESESPASYAYYVNEAAALRVLPTGVAAPRLRHVVQRDGWIALILSYVPGRPAGPPWTEHSIRAALGALSDVAVASAGVPPIVGLLRDLDGWRRLGDHADAWERDNAARLADVVADWPEWTAGSWVVHQDVRADNVIVAPDGRSATLVDWSFCCSGADWLDRARLAADVVCTGHVDGVEAAHRSALRIIADLPDRSWRFVAALAGMWRIRSTFPADPAMPTMRRWQRDRALALRPLLDRWIHQLRVVGG
jgi:hypothetical protein